MYLCILVNAVGPRPNGFVFLAPNRGAVRRGPRPFVLLMSNQRSPQWRSTTIYYDVAARFDLTHAEYCILDFIRVMQGDPKNERSGRCTYTTPVIARSLRLSVSTVKKTIALAASRGLLLADRENRQVSSEFFDAVALAKEGVIFTPQETEAAKVENLHPKGVKNAPQRCKNDTLEVENLHLKGVKNAPLYKNKIDRDNTEIDLEKQRDSAHESDFSDYEEIPEPSTPQSRPAKKSRATDTTPVSGNGNLANAKKQQTEQTAAELLEILNDLTQRTGNGRFQAARGTLAPIVARLNEGFAAADIELVFQHKAVKWLGDPKMRGYLTPTTLCGLQKFPQYLADAHRDQALMQTGEYFKNDIQIKRDLAFQQAAQGLNQERY